MTPDQPWQEISFAAARGREMALALSGVFLMVFAVPWVAFIAFRVANSLTFALSLVGSTAAASIVASLYVSELRQSTRRVAFAPDSVTFENRNGAQTVRGSIEFEDINEIRASLSRSGVAFVQTRAGTKIRLGPGFGFGGALLNQFLGALRPWAVRHRLELVVADAFISQVFRFRYKRILLSEASTSTSASSASYSPH